MRVTRLWNGFWAWYERNYVLNVALASVLFLLQIAHLTWLGADPIASRLTDHALFSLHGLLQYLIWFADYSEIPALVIVSLVYVNELRRGFSWKALLFLVFLNSQWLHIFWITDEYVAAELGGGGGGPALPGWLAWVAILIDYLELPVIFDTLKRLALAIRERRLPAARYGDAQIP
ncbi:MAG: hypothetical protein QOE60_155 [Thermoleophilaceae bacterium]|nr:hypothetical protein [Thermoleophilaceae bacterium]